MLAATPAADFWVFPSLRPVLSSQAPVTAPTFFSTSIQVEAPRRTALFSIDPNGRNGMAASIPAQKASPSVSSPSTAASSPSPGQSATASPSPKLQPQLPFARRPIKSATSALKDKIADRTTRASRFLKGMKQRGEEKRWQARGGDDELQRSNFFAEQEQLDEFYRQQAANEMIEPDMIEQDLLEEPPVLHELDELERQEQLELEMLIDMYDADLAPSSQPEHTSFDMPSSRPQLSQRSSMIFGFDNEVEEELAAVFDEFDSGYTQEESQTTTATLVSDSQSGHEQAQLALPFPASQNDMDMSMD